MVEILRSEYQTTDFVQVIECHGPCAQTMRRIRSWNVTLMTENMHGGMDGRSRKHAARPLNPKCAVTCERSL